MALYSFINSTFVAVDTFNSLFFLLVMVVNDGKLQTRKYSDQMAKQGA